MCFLSPLLTSAFSYIVYNYVYGSLTKREAKMAGYIIMYHAELFYSNNRSINQSINQSNQSEEEKPSFDIVVDVLNFTMS